MNTGLNFQLLNPFPFLLYCNIAKSNSTEDVNKNIKTSLFG